MIIANAALLLKQTIDEVSKEIVGRRYIIVSYEDHFLNTA